MNLQKIEAHEQWDPRNWRYMHLKGCSDGLKRSSCSYSVTWHTYHWKWSFIDGVFKEHHLVYPHVFIVFAWEEVSAADCTINYCYKWGWASIVCNDLRQSQHRNWQALEKCIPPSGVGVLACCEHDCWPIGHVLWPIVHSSNKSMNLLGYVPFWTQRNREYTAWWHLFLKVHVITLWAYFLSNCRIYIDRVAIQWWALNGRRTMIVTSLCSQVYIVSIVDNWPYTLRWSWNKLTCTGVTRKMYKQSS